MAEAETMRERVILYSDLNNFFASVETVLHPEFIGKPLIVCGDPRERRGVVFAKKRGGEKVRDPNGGDGCGGAAEVSPRAYVGNAFRRI